MARHKSAKPSKITPGLDLNQQGANALLAATFDFLRRNNISKKSILEFTRKHLVRNQRDRSLRVYRELEQAQEDMGVIMGTWFSIQDPLISREIRCLSMLVRARTR